MCTSDCKRESRKLATVEVRIEWGGEQSVGCWWFGGLVNDVVECGETLSGSAE